MRILVAVLGVTLSGTLALGSVLGSPRRGEPFGNAPALDDASAQRGQLVFMEHCNECHPGGENGLGPALNNKPLPKRLMAFQVRRGLGAMPAFSSEEIDGSELTDLLNYLVALRRGS